MRGKCSQGRLPRGGQVRLGNKECKDMGHVRGSEGRERHSGWWGGSYRIRGKEAWIGQAHAESKQSLKGMEHRSEI
jgi:hypothetical protein